MPKKLLCKQINIFLIYIYTYLLKKICHICHNFFQGHPRLVQNLAKLYSPLIGRELDPLNEIIVTSGAYEALFSAILGKYM